MQMNVYAHITSAYKSCSLKNSTRINYRLTVELQSIIK